MKQLLLTLLLALALLPPAHAQSPKITIEDQLGTKLIPHSISPFSEYNFAGVTMAITLGGNNLIGLKSDGTLIATDSDDLPVGLGRVKAIAGSNTHKLALQEDGAVAQWDSSWRSRSNAPFGLRGVVAIAAGIDYSMALRGDGTVVEWDDYGLREPQKDLTGITAISVGSGHRVALRSDGTVVAWGANSSGQTNVPSGLTNVIAIAAGCDHTVALKGDGTVICWGDHSDGKSTPPAGLTGVTAIAAGCRFSVALKSDGSLVKWGTYYGPLPSIVSSISSNNGYLVAISGKPIDFGQQRTGTTSASRTFTIRNTGTAPLSISSISVTGAHAGDFTVSSTTTLMEVPFPAGETSFTVDFTPRAAGARGAVLKVASNSPGLGNFSIVLRGESIPQGPEISLEQPVGIPFHSGSLFTSQDRWQAEDDAFPIGLTGITAIAKNSFEVLDSYDTYLLKNDGAIYRSNQWQFIPPERILQSTPNMVDIAAGVNYAVALRSDGTVWTNGPAVPASLTGVTAISAGVHHTVALKENGTVTAWGEGPPVPDGLSGVTAIAAGAYHTVALKGDGTVISWGGGPPLPNDLAGVKAIAAGYYHTIALKEDGTVVSLGTNITNPYGLTGVKAIEAGPFGSIMALKYDGSVIMWGTNSSDETPFPDGLIGVKSMAFTDRNRAVAIVGPSVNFGLQPLETSSGVETITIRNTGSEPLSISSVSLVGGNTADFTLNTAGMLAEIPATSGVTAFTVSFTPRAAGARGTTLRVVSNDSDEGTFDITLAGRGTLPGDSDGDGMLDSWEALHFGSGGSLPNNDDDRDTRSNYYEYAYGTNPRSADANLLPQAALQDGLLTLTLTKQPFVNYVIQGSSNLTTWDTTGLTTITDNETTLTVQETAPATRRWLRARAYPTR